MRTWFSRLLICALALLVGSCEEAPFTPAPPRGAEGACCLPDECSYTDEDSCDGLFIKGELCDPNPCPSSSVAACCADDGTCTMREPSACSLSQREFLPDQICSPNPCAQPQVGACCSDLGECREAIDERVCRRDRHTFMGDGVMCAEDTCPKVIQGRCCLENGSCEIIDEPRCRGAWNRSIDCDPNTCPPPPEGACCEDEGTDCSVANRFTCEARFMGPESECSVELCTIPTDAGPDTGDAAVDAGADGRASDGPIPDGPIADGPLPDGPLADGPLPDGPLADGPAPDGPAPDGPAPDGPWPDAEQADSAQQ